MSKLKLLLGLLVICFISSLSAIASYSSDISVPVKGKTIASKELQQKSLFTVYSFALRAASSDCQSFAITDTKVTKSKAEDKWEELWTVDACKDIVEVPIVFTENTEKSTYAVDFMGVKVSKKTVKGR